MGIEEEGIGVESMTPLNEILNFRLIHQGEFSTQVGGGYRCRTSWEIIRCIGTVLLSLECIIDWPVSAGQENL